MNKARIGVGLTAFLGFGIAVACGSGSGNNNGGGNSGNDSGPSGSSSGSSSSGGTPASSGGTGCGSGQSLCVAILGGSSCIDAGAMCLGTNVVAAECSATSPCPGSQVCCSSYVGVDGGILTYADAAAPDAAAMTAGDNFGGVAVQCLSSCPTNALSSEVCVLDADGGSPTACPEGTTCQDFGFTLLTSSMVPTTLCLPVYEAGAYGYYPPDASAGSDAASTTPSDAGAPVTDAPAD
jgi:hypothetical protein